jgi:hypothetical protein
MRSSGGMNEERTLRVVVFPEPVPPDTTIFSLDLTAPCKNSTIVGVKVPKFIRSSAVKGSLENLRMVIHGPTKETGGITAFTLDPSGSLASTIGLASSIRLPIGATILSIMCIT